MNDEKVFNIGGLNIYDATEEAKRVLQSRDEFIKNYCQEKGWDRDNLSFEQTLEIRKQEGWKHST